MATELDDSTIEALGKHAEEPGAGAPAASAQVQDAPAATPAAGDGGGQQPAGGAPAGAEGSGGAQGQPQGAEGDGGAGGARPDGDLPQLDKAQLAKLWQRYKGDLLELDDAKQAVTETAEQIAQRQILERSTDPVHNPEYQALVREYEDHGKRLADTLEATTAELAKLRAGDLDVDMRKIADNLEGAIKAAARQRDLALAASEHRSVVMIDGVVNALFGDQGETEVGKADGKPLTLDAAWGAALAGYDRLRQSQDPAQRASAAAWFAQTALPVIYNLGVQRGVAHGRQQAQKEIAPKIDAAEDAALREAIAKVGASTPPSPSGGSVAPTSYTAEQIAKMSDAEYDAKHDEIHQLIGSLMGS
jgi:hypothetical protein